MTLTREETPKQANTRSKVKGPIRCHKCQLKCRDAEHYLSHKCEIPSAPKCLPYPVVASFNGRR
jgi:hypothetical protein